jgi:hypothetical protein
MRASTRAGQGADHHQVEGVAELGGHGRLEPGPPLGVGEPGQVLAVGVQQVEAVQADRPLVDRLGDAMLAAAVDDLLERS